MHYLVWIVPQQIYKYGDLWRFCTAGIESRGAILKRIGRNNVCWRPFQQGVSVYHYIDVRTQKEVTRQQTYKSSPMEQMLRLAVARECTSHSDCGYAHPQKLRLELQQRKRKLKCEFAPEEGSENGCAGKGGMAHVFRGMVAGDTPM